jgi:uncharacterized membrane protein
MEAQGHEPNWKNMVGCGIAWIIACSLLVLALLYTLELVRTIMYWITASIQDVQKARDFAYTVTAIIVGVSFISCITSVGLAVWLDYFFRGGVKIGKLASRVTKVFIVEILVIVFTFAGRVAIQVLGF